MFLLIQRRLGKSRGSLFEITLHQSELCLLMMNGKNRKYRRMMILGITQILFRTYGLGISQRSKGNSCTIFPILHRISLINSKNWIRIFNPPSRGFSLDLKEPTRPSTAIYGLPVHGWLKSRAESDFSFFLHQISNTSTERLCLDSSSKEFEKYLIYSDEQVGSTEEYLGFQYPAKTLVNVMTNAC